MYPLLAQVEFTGEWSAVAKVSVGILGLLAIASLVFTVVIQAKKLFGRKPPLADELEKIEKRVHGQVTESFERAYKRADEAHARVSALRQEIDLKLERDLQDLEIKMQHDRQEIDIKFTRLQEERLRELQEINRTFQSMERGLGRLEGGKLEK